MWVFEFLLCLTLAPQDFTKVKNVELLDRTLCKDLSWLHGVTKMARTANQSVGLLVEILVTRSPTKEQLYRPNHSVIEIGSGQWSHLSWNEASGPPAEQSWYDCYDHSLQVGLCIIERLQDICQLLSEHLLLNHWFRSTVSSGKSHSDGSCVLGRIHCDLSSNILKKAYHIVTDNFINL